MNIIDKLSMDGNRVLRQFGDAHFDDVFRMNDWKFNKFITVILSFQFLVWGFFLLNYWGIEFPLIGSSVIFVYLIFVPGILLLRIGKIHNLSATETLLYTVGLSVAFLMFFGLFVNFIIPLFGVDRPFSFNYLAIFISMFVLIMILLSDLRDRNYAPTFNSHYDVNSFPVFLFLCLLPFLSILGTFLVNSFNVNYLLMILILLVSVVPLLVTFNRIPSNFYPLAVFSVSLSLIYHTSLISTYLTGWDIQMEYYLSNLVLTNAYWDQTIGLNYNSMISVTLLAPLFSDLLKMNLTTVFKVIYPFLYSFVPVGLFMIFKKQTNAKIAFLSSFLFMSVFVFYFDMIWLARQEIAEIFLVLVLLLLVNETIVKFKRSILFAFFAVCIVFSHYAISILCFYGFVFAFLILKLKKIPALEEFYYKLIGKDRNNYFTLKNENMINTRFILFFFIVILSWYVFTSSSSIMVTIVEFLRVLTVDFIPKFLNPLFSESSALILQQHGTMLGQINKNLHLVTQFFILIGLIGVLFKRVYLQFKREYVAFSISSLLLLIASLAVPYLAGQLNAPRLYHIQLIVLVPFSIIGGIMLFNLLFKGFKGLKIALAKKSFSNSLRLLSIFLAIFLLFNTYFVNELTLTDPKSIAISKGSVDKYGDLNSAKDYYVSSFYISRQDVYGMNWLLKNKYSNLIYVDSLYWHMFESYGVFPIGGLDNLNNSLYQNSTQLLNFDGEMYEKVSYLYMGTFNTKHNSFIWWISEKFFYEIRILPQSTEKNVIYSNGNSEIVIE